MKLNTKLNLASHEGGFTLIEMLIVVAIIAILVAIAVPALNTAKADAQAAKRDAIASSVATAKVRALLNDEGVQGAAASFTEFGKYLLVNGAAPSLAALANSASNGAGSYIDTWGTYPADSDGSATALAWTSASASSVTD